jgi:hypothetical protein
MKLLPKLKGACLNFLAGCIRRGDSWEFSKKIVLEEFFPFIVREKLIRELIVFKFHSKEVPLRTYIDEIVDAAEFLNYFGTESEMVDRILMNLHPDILAQSAFLQRPSSFHELRILAGHIEEKLAVQVER